MAGLSRQTMLPGPREHRKLQDSRNERQSRRQ
jgi:hypothetical protein